MEAVTWFIGRYEMIYADTARIITEVDYADDIALLANTPTQAESLLHSLERAAASIGLHVNADKTEYMCFNQRGDISTLKSGPLKVVHPHRKQCLIKRERHKYATSKGIDSSQSNGS